MEQDEISNVNTSDDLASRNLASMTEEEASIEPAIKKEKIPTSMSSPDNIKTKPKKRFTKIKIPPRVKKRGRPKGAELKDIGLSSSKKTNRTNPKNMIVPFIKLKCAEKEKILSGLCERCLKRIRLDRTSFKK